MGSPGLAVGSTLGAQLSALGSLFWFGQVAQLVEHGTENPGVGSSILPLPTNSFKWFPLPL